jgi:chemotaxis protein MotA
MDRGTLFGLIAANGLILFAIGTGIMLYIDITSALIVLGGTAGALCVAFPMEDIQAALKAARKTFYPQRQTPTETVRTLAHLSRLARRDGLLSLERAADSTEDAFLATGLRMMVDGQDAAAIENVMYDNIDKVNERHSRAIEFWDAIATYGPGMGLVGTLIGLVRMLYVMGDDPTSIGHPMAVALLTTLYGAYLANIVGQPFANKLRARSRKELAHKELVASGLLSILAGENPRFMVERLNAALAPSERVKEEAA